MSKFRVGDFDNFTDTIVDDMRNKAGLAFVHQRSLMFNLVEITFGYSYIHLSWFFIITHTFLMVVDLFLILIFQT
ncbi:hypothetical protein AYJ70_03415 [Pseudomonas monteilii]|uniref:Uncharacterized protein n=1 Tax=Pseudomonas monteilii TaxID=76759 RepID=A0AAP7FQT1_9PSED|nr:hypothetical protein AYJ70_03415 [Pseudomonas monteilii]